MSAREELHALQHNNSHRTSIEVNGCYYEIARICSTAQLSDQRIRRSGKFGRHMAMVDQQIAEVKLGSLWLPKKITGDRITWGDTAASPSQKLRSTAIYWHFVAAEPLLPFQPFQFLSCP
jgi:hypothetical protein